MSEISAGRFDTFDSALFADERDATAYIWTSVLLTGLLVVAVPVSAAVSDIPTSALVVLAGVVYVAAVVATGTAFEGFATSVFVLTLFDIAVTLVEGPGIAAIDLVAADVVVIPLFVVLVYEWVDGGVSVGANARAVSVAAFAGFVGWSFLATFFGSGPSELAAGMFAIEQLRYLVVFVTAALVVRRAGVWCGIYPFVIATCGHLLVSLAQIVNGGRLGFPFLGEPPDRYLGSFTFMGFEIATGFYAGGFVGHGRELAMVLFMFIPLVVVVALRHSWIHVALSGVAVAASVFSVRVADTDAGWATLILLFALFGPYLLYVALVRVKRRYSTAALVPVLAAVAGFAFVLVRGIETVLQPNSAGKIPLFRTNTLAVRIDGYVAAVRIALDNPLFGLGGKNFYLLSAEYGLPPDIGVHNTYLSHLAATGFVGFGLYMIAVIAVFWVALRAALESHGNERVLWVAVVCAMVAYHAYSSWMMSYHWTVGNAAFWLLCGIAVGATMGENGRFQSISGRIA